MYYLYVKTHNKTGLKYLGKTMKSDPHLYKGSGKRWLSHLKKHGYDYTTQILLFTEDKEELKQTGIFFSRIWNIVKSDDWANLTEEKGDGVDSTTAKKNILLRIENGSHPWAKGNRSYAMDNNGRDKKGLTYEQIYGKEKALDLKKSRSKSNKQRWKNDSFREQTSAKISQTRKDKFARGELVAHNKGKSNPNTEFQKKKERIRNDFILSGLSRKEYAEKNNLNYTTFKKYVTGL